MLVASVLYMLLSGRSNPAREKCPLPARILSFSWIYWILHCYLPHPGVPGIDVVSGIGVVGVDVLYLPPPLSGSVTIVQLEVFILSVSEMSQSRMVRIKHTHKSHLDRPLHIHIQTILLYALILAQFLYYINFKWSQKNSL